jgi:hypothetical protein
VDNLDLYHIRQTWTDLREARVKDGFIFRVSRYFIDHWLRLLGPKAAWAVVDLQQRCYLSKADSCLVSLKELCAATGVRSTTTMQGIVDQPLMGWFFAKRTTRRHRDGKVVRGKNCYDLQMSDPLTPAHQGQVARLLAERLRDGSVEGVRSADDLIRLVSDLPPPASLPSDAPPAWATREPLNLRQIALRVLSEAGVTDVPSGLADEPALRQAFADAQAQVTQPTRIALTTHYFRTEWVPELGATKAWLIMVLRSRCYWNKESGQVRDTCVMSMQELADLLGVSARTVSRGLQDRSVLKFAAVQGRVYEPRAEDGRKTPSRTRFQVRLTMDPLTPPDEAAFAEILLSDAARYGLDPATGQMDMLAILDMMGQMTTDEIGRRRDGWGDKTGIRRGMEIGSGDKIEIRARPRSAPTVGSGDKNGIRAPVPTPVEGPKTGRRGETGRIRPRAEGWEGPAEGESSDKNGIRGQSDDKIGFRDAESSDRIDTAAPTSGDKTEKQYLNTSINTITAGEGQQQQYHPPAAAAPAILQQALVEYGIEEPALSRILANPQVTLELARAWMLYADNEAGLKHKAGYVVQRLTQSPPDAPADPGLLLVASLNDDDLAAFAQRRALESRMAASVTFGDARREAQYRAWLRLYGQERDVTHRDETAVEPDGRRTSRWRPDVG